MIEAGVVGVRVVPETAGFGSTLGGALSKAGAGLTSAGKTLTRGLTIPLVAAGGIATKMALDFDQAFTKIDALSNTSQKNLEQWRGQVMQLSGQTAQAPTDLANALFFLASAGLKTKDVFPALESSAKGAAAGMGNVADLAKITAQALNAYAQSGLKASTVSDTLTAAVKASAAEPAEFSTALGRILPIASKAGVSFDQVAGSLAGLSNIGLDVNEGVTAMRGLLQSIYAPGTAAAETLKKVGLSAGELRNSIQQDGLLGAMQLLDKATHGNIDQLRTIIPNIRALTAQFGLTGENAKTVADIFHQVAHATGETGKAFKTTTKSDAFKFKKMLNDLRIAAIQLGETLIPILERDIVPAIQKIVKWWNQLGDSGRSTAVKIAILVAALGPLLRILGGIASLGGGVIKIISAIAGAASGGGAAAAGEQLALFGGAASGGLAGFIALAAPAVVAIGLITGGIIAANIEANHFDQSVVDLANHMGKVEGAAKNVKDELASQTGGFKAGQRVLPDSQIIKRDTLALTKYNQSIRDIVNSSGLAGDSYKNWATAQLQNASATKKQSTAITGQLQTLQSLHALTPKLKQEMHNLLSQGDVQSAVKLGADAVKKAWAKFKLPPPKIDKTSANKDIASLKQNLGKQLQTGKPTKIPVDADTKAATNHIKDVADNLRKLNQQKTKPLVDPQTAAALQKVGAFQRAYGAIKDKSVTLTVNIAKKGATGLAASIPSFATGGYITHGPQLAVIGEAGPEAVVPLTRKGMVGSHPPAGLGLGGPMEISGELTLSPDGRAFVEGVLTDHEAFQARGARARR